MKELLDFLQLSYADEPNKAKIIIETIQRLYFSYVKHPWKFLRFSEEYRIANDLLNLERAISDKRSIRGLNLRSRMLKENHMVTTLGLKDSLENWDVAQLESLIGSNKYYITSVFIADIISMESQANALKWIITVIVSMITAIIVKKFSGS